MLHVKLLVGLCLVTTCILADKVIDVSVTSAQLSSEDQEHQIDTAALGDVIHDTSNNELQSRVENSAEDKCKSANGIGLKNLIQKVDKLIPKKEIKKIIKSYSQDPEIKALRAFARNSETRQKLKTIKNSKEFQLLKDYSCRILHLDLETYHNIAQNLINQSNNRANNSERKGIKGLLNALRAALPHQKLRELYENLMKTDDELVKAVAHLKSDEFHQLLLNVRNLPESQELRKQLLILGVPVDEMRDVLAQGLGWPKSVDVLF